MNPMLLARHAETDLSGRFCGHSDPPLNEAGKQHVPTMVAALSEWRIEQVYTSDLKRCRQTAEPIAKHFGARLEERSALREIHFGKWEGLTWADVESRYLEETRDWADQFPAYTIPNGEPYVEFERRVLRELEFLQTQAETQQILIVTHAGVLRIALEKIGGMTADEAWEHTRNCGAVFSALPSKVTMLTGSAD